MASGVGVRGMNITPGRKIVECCDGCHLGKMHKKFFSSNKFIPTTIGELVVTDVVGQIQQKSVSGGEFYVFFKDVFSKYKVAYFLKHKSETAECFKSYTIKMKTDTGKSVKILRSDNGGEYMSHNFKTWLADNGIKHQTCAAHTPEQNGIAERDHRSTVEPARCQKHAKGAPLKLWAEAVNHSVYVLNRT